MYSDVIIRNERPGDYRMAENLARESFWNVYRPGCTEHYVLHCMRDDPAFVRELDFVMFRGGEMIGQNVFVRANITADDGRKIPVCAMGPICIAPGYQRQGYGKILLDYSVDEARKLGVGAVCFEGNIGFYGKSGFTCARKFGLRYHGFDDAPFFLCKELVPSYLDGITGEYAPPEVYFSADRNPAGFEEFDALFPRREKKVLPGQLFPQ
ncbi:MAG: N-acetyltransferase [Synergistaceae bacterium]|nr:N-acetyltransferase [Synergistaceae bacterium]